jgi:two-component system phosphate regulon sensor histidine kinase PhoR
MLVALDYLGWAVAAAALGGLAAMLLRARRSWRAAERFLDELARLRPHNLSSGAADGAPPLPPKHPLAAAAQQARQAVAVQYEAFQQLDHARAAAEVRSRRAAADAEQVRAVFAQLAEPVLVVDQYGELVMTNRSACQLLGLDENEVARRALRDVVKCQKLVELLMSAVQRKGQGNRTDEFAMADAEGREHWFRATAAKLAGEDAHVQATAGAVAVLRDIGDRKALQKRNAEFVSAVSHEMKTPLAGIKAYVELLADGDAEDEATREEFLQIINGQTDRMQRLIENLLNLARIEAGVVQVQKQPQSLNEVLEEALRVVRPAAEAKQIALGADLSPLYLGVLADRDMLLQAAINLLSNAIKYTPDGGRVTLRSRMEDSEIRFEVEDSGVGLSEEDSRRVFDKFYRVKKDKNMAAGTGLGLPLAKHIVEDVHGGRITVASKLGEGSTFAVHLPNQKQNADGRR